MPANVVVLKVNEMPRKVSDIFGGLTLTTCTSGFSVRNSSGTKGITTAGHCNNSQSYNGVNLPFQSGTPDSGGIYDIQWHTAPGFTVRNLIFDGTYNRYIFSVKFRANQSVGERVCKYGKTTGYACGTIATTSQDGVNVRVDNMTLQGGDSSGPWFWNNTAYGTTIAACTLSNGNPYAIYGPVDQIYNILGLTVLTN
ncbi:MAG: S1 family peptidase [Gemmatales bacterium]|nr:S1 family peptidase [Gemmatales bacterium]